MQSLSTSPGRVMAKGRYYDEFEPGRVLVHHWGRTLHQSDNVLFCTMLMHFNPLYFNAEFARAHGHPSEVINPYLAFNVVFGLSVEDLSEAGGYFLGMKGLRFLLTVYPGDTLTARSTVVDRRESGSKPGFGIATWHTEGFNQREELVLDYQRSNFVRKRETAQ